LGSGIRL